MILPEIFEISEKVATLWKLNTQTKEYIDSNITKGSKFKEYLAISMFPEGCETPKIWNCSKTKNVRWNF